ncbi:MAG: M24 family metallopeptidase [SAR202 cluster bacterium]|nr:M24 family metallopeptidase [SAR202 cluster bacterium]
MTINKIEQNDFSNRRKTLMSHNMDGATIIAAGHNSPRNHDVNHQFRQQSDFWYFTGFEEPDAVMVLLPNDTKPYVMFTTPFDQTFAIWNGPMEGIEGIQNDYGVDAAYSIKELTHKLPELLKGYTKLYFSIGLDPILDQVISNIVTSRRSGAARDGNYITNIIDPKQTIDNMRLLKSQNEINLLKTAIDITTDGFNKALNFTKPGKFEYEIQAELEKEFRKAGSVRNGYPSIVASGNNSCVLHYTNNNSELKNGDLLLIDAGAEMDYYTADITRTWPINGNFTDLQKDIYSIVLEAQIKAINDVKPEATIDSINKTTVTTLTDGLIQIGLLTGNTEKLVEEKAYRKYYMHGTSHWLGIDVHDAGVYSKNNSFTKLKPGMVLTVEPGLYFSKYIDELPQEMKGIGIRIEDNILVTKTGNINLSQKIPKEIDEIEPLIGILS